MNSGREKLCYNNFGLAMGTVVYNDELKLKLEAHPVKCYNGDITDTILQISFRSSRSGKVGIIGI